MLLRQQGALSSAVARMYRMIGWSYIFWGADSFLCGLKWIEYRVVTKTLFLYLLWHKHVCEWYILFFSAEDLHCCA